MAYKDLYQKLCYNDKHHWSRILETVSQDSPILCKVKEMGIAQEDIGDISKGSPYIKINYYEMKSNKITKQTVIYRCIPKLAYAKPSQVMTPKVNVTQIGNDIHLSKDEYQWLCLTLIPSIKKNIFLVSYNKTYLFLRVKRVVKT